MYLDMNKMIHLMQSVSKLLYNAEVFDSKSGLVVYKQLS